MLALALNSAHRVIVVDQGFIFRRDEDRSEMAGQRFSSSYFLSFS